MLNDDLLLLNGVIYGQEWFNDCCRPFATPPCACAVRCLAERLITVLLYAHLDEEVETGQRRVPKKRTLTDGSGKTNAWTTGEQWLL